MLESFKDIIPVLGSISTAFSSLPLLMEYVIEDEGPCDVIAFTWTISLPEGVFSIISTSYVSFWKWSPLEAPIFSPTYICKTPGKEKYLILKRATFIIFGI